MLVMSPVTYDKDRLTARVAENIKMARIRRDLSGRELAELIGDDGVSHTWVSNRETGDVSCTMRDISALAKALRVSEAELLGYEELARPELHDLNRELRDPRLPRAALDIVLGLVGQAVAVAIMATPRRRALPPAPKEPQMTTKKTAPRRRAS